MSSFLFRSPQPFVQQFVNPFATSPFAPQEHPFSPFAFSPQTPSPLRTSKNVNIMGPSNNETGHVKPDGEDAITTFMPQEESHPTQIPSFSAVKQSPSTAFETPVTTTFPSQQLFTSASFAPSSTSSLATSSSDQAQRASQFQQRSRQSSPSAQLSSHLRENRDNRKRLFLDRLRNKRDDARDERGEQQILKSEYLREQRSWEEFKRREGMQQPGPDDLDIELEMEMMAQEEGELSPPEEREIEELASYYINDQTASHVAMPFDNFHTDDFMEDDEGYDEAFMEVLTQQQEVSLGQQRIREGADNSMNLDHEMS